MNVWNIAPVEDEPDTALSSWAVYEAEITAGVLTRHLVGNAAFDGGRVSSAIERFDLKERRVLTSSGRVYLLLGRPKYDSDAEYTWKCWVRINEAINVRDVTADLLAMGGDYML